MNWTKYELKHPTYRRKLEKCIKSIKKSNLKNHRLMQRNPWAVCRATVKKP